MTRHFTTLATLGSALCLLLVLPGVAQAACGTSTAKAAGSSSMAKAAGSSSTAKAAGGTISGTVSARPHRFLKETVLYLTDGPAPKAPKTFVIDQKGMKFIPHVLAIVKGDTVKYTNQDNVKHNVMSPDHGGYNLGMIAKGQTVQHTFTKLGSYAQLCAVHPEMLAYVYVAPSRYNAIVNASGHFTIKNVPAGTYHLAVWNARLKGKAQSVTVTAGKTSTVTLSVARH